MTHTEHRPATGYTLFAHQGTWAARTPDGAWLRGAPPSDGAPVTLAQARHALPSAPPTSATLPAVDVRGDGVIADATRLITAGQTPSGGVALMVTEYAGIPTKFADDHGSDAPPWHVHVWVEGRAVFAVVTLPPAHRAPGHAQDVTADDVALRRTTSALSPQLMRDYLTGERHTTGCALSPWEAHAAAARILLDVAGEQHTRPRQPGDLPVNRRLSVYTAPAFTRADHPVFPVPTPMAPQ